MSFGAPADFRWATQTCALRWKRNHSPRDELHPHRTIQIRIRIRLSVAHSLSSFTRCLLRCSALSKSAKHLAS